MKIDPAVLSLTGALVTAAIAVVANRLIELWKHRTETRTDAYTAFIEAFSRVATLAGMMGPMGLRGLNPAQLDKWIEAQVALRAAKAKVALYAPPEVLGKLGNFTAEHAALEKNADADAFILFMTEMRKDSFAKDYAGFGGDVDRLMLRDEMVMGPDGKLTSLRKRMEAIAAGEPLPPAPPPPPRPGPTISFGTGDKA